MKVLAFSLSLWLLGALIISISMDFINDYDLFNTEDHPVIITEKFSKKSLTGTPTYYVTVNLNEESSSSAIQNKVFPWQFKRLDVGDTIKGHNIHGEHFFTTLDVVIDSVVVLVFLLLLIFLLLLLLSWPLLIFIEKREEENKPSRYFKIKERKKLVIQEKLGKQFLVERIVPGKFQSFFRKLSVWHLFISLLFVFVFLFTSGFVINGIQKFSPIGKTTTEALVIDAGATSEIYYYIGKYTDPYYSLSLLFTDAQGMEFRVIKEVTRAVYKRHFIGDTIKISYVTRNPYNVFIPDFSLVNLWDSIKYNKFILKVFVLLAVLISFLIYYYFFGKKKRK